MATKAKAQPQPNHQPEAAAAQATAQATATAGETEQQPDDTPLLTTVGIDLADGDSSTTITVLRYVLNEQDVEAVAAIYHAVVGPINMEPVMTGLRDLVDEAATDEAATLEPAAKAVAQIAARAIRRACDNLMADYLQPTSPVIVDIKRRLGYHALPMTLEDARALPMFMSASANSTPVEELQAIGANEFTSFKSAGGVTMRIVVDSSGNLASEPLRPPEDNKPADPTQDV